MVLINNIINNINLQIHNIIKSFVANKTLYLLGLNIDEMLNWFTYIWHDFAWALAWKENCHNIINVKCDQLFSHTKLSKKTFVMPKIYDYAAKVIHLQEQVFFRPQGVAHEFRKYYTQLIRLNIYTNQCWITKCHLLCKVMYNDFAIFVVVRSIKR